MCARDSDLSIRLGISACLLGDNVRYDGGNKYNAFIAETLGRFFDLVHICPETGAGLGIPRPPIRLVATNRGIRAVGAEDHGLDVTIELESFAMQQLALFNELCGFIAKSRSPSCGLTDASIATPNGIKQGSGILIQQLCDTLPYLPVIDERALLSATDLDHFLERVFALSRWKNLTKVPLTSERLRQFHTQHAFVLAQHDATAHRRLSGILAEFGEIPVEISAMRYLTTFMSCLGQPPPKGGQSAMLMAMHQCLARTLGKVESAQLAAAVAEYADGNITLDSVISLIRTLAESHGVDEIAQATWLNPSPLEAALRYRGCRFAPG